MVGTDKDNEDGGWQRLRKRWEQRDDDINYAKIMVLVFAGIVLWRLFKLGQNNLLNWW